ncbi:hypothetical protein [Thalassospira xiamenensis]|uniref:hypothetical protein n=1 Tax=Thalassospira xiamenensis TaxID=220697 RepID=UPI003AA8FA69
MLDICGSSFVRGWVNSCGSLRFSVFVAVSLLALALSSEVDVFGEEAVLSERPPEFNLEEDVSDEAGLLSTVLLAFFFPNMGMTKSLSCSFVSGFRRFIRCLSEWRQAVVRFSNAPRRTE